MGKANTKQSRTCENNVEATGTVRERGMKVHKWKMSAAARFECEAS